MHEHKNFISCQNLLTAVKNNKRGHAFSPNWCHLGTVVGVFVVSSPNLLGEAQSGSYERF